MGTKWVRKSSHIQFNLVGDTGKTETWEVESKGNIYLGEIKWYAQWRKYCFFPETNCIFDSECLMDIHAFINKLMLPWKK